MALHFFRVSSYILKYLLALRDVNNSILFISDFKGTVTRGVIYDILDSSSEIIFGQDFNAFITMLHRKTLKAKQISLPNFSYYSNIQTQTATLVTIRVNLWLRDVIHTAVCVLRVLRSLLEKFSFLDFAMSCTP